MGEAGGSWKELAEAKRKAILDSIPAQWRLPVDVPTAKEQKDVTGAYIQQFLNKREIQITETDAVGIAKETATGGWTALETNCLHETFFDAALEDAKAQDKYLKEHKKPIGPLHGVPISLKDQFHVKNVETTMGYVGWINTFEGQKDDPRKGVFESEMVRELRALGAILFCKTSVPHTLMSGETVNNIIGYTWNPKDRYICSGGSSGGEGALIGAKGSPAGFGTDIGGSVRIPAAFNGLYGLRPSSGRLPYEGMANTMDGQNSVLSVVGPLATSAASIKLIVQSILSQKPWLHDPLVNEIPWRNEKEKEILDLIRTSSSGRGQLAFGLLKHDGVVSLHPPVKRALQIVESALVKLGHKIINWEPPSHAHGNSIVLKTWIYDGGADVFKDFGLSGEPVASQVQKAYGTQPKEQMNASQIAENNVAKRKWQKDYLEYWNSTSESTGTGRPVDAFIAPLAPFPAARENKFDYYGYSTFVNGLDYTSMAFPVTTADKTVDVVDTNFQPVSELDKKIQDDCE
ncbi:MAG: hypothetical protein Q9227_004036 [Pyrenula ochraceoflavens]